MDKNLEDRVVELEKDNAKLKSDVYALAKTMQLLWEDFVERDTTRRTAPLREALGLDSSRGWWNRKGLNKERLNNG